MDLRSAIKYFEILNIHKTENWGGRGVEVIRD